MPKELDKWSDWLVSRRYGNDKHLALQTVARLERIRDKILRNALISKGELVLDIGTGDGLIGLEVLKFIGEEGKVYFTDISLDALDICKKRVENSAINVNQAQFIQQSADNLSFFREASIDVVTGRAVLMYINLKKQCFEEFFRVLKPGGRVAIFEPINKFTAVRAPDYLGLDFSELDSSISKKILSALGYPLDIDSNPMLNFDERDLFDFAESAGFKDIKIEHQTIKTSKVMLPPWETFLESSPNPLTPPLKFVLNSLSDEEKRIATNYLLRAWKRPLRSGYHSETFLTATK